MNTKINNSRSKPYRTLDEAPSLRGTRVIVRASLNVPLVDGVVRDNFRIKEACETVLYLKERGVRVIVLAHIGREPEETLKPVSECMQEFVPHTWVGEITGEKVTSAIAVMKDGDVILLENVRSDAREMSNDDTFARTLASLGDIYVNDAFADSHRAHASIVGIPSYVPSYAGLLFAREYEALSPAFDPPHPALFILGGAKFETKLPLVERFVKKYDQVFIGGAIVNDCLKGKGYEVGTSKISDIDLSSWPLLDNPHIVLPSDVVVLGPRGRAVKAVGAVLADEAILDIGPATIKNLAPLVSEAKIVLWNGPLGNYENGYTDATNALAALIARAEGTSIIGGGDTVAAIEALELNTKFDFVSTAGGAMLEFLENETLPGIEALRLGSTEG